MSKYVMETTEQSEEKEMKRIIKRSQHKRITVGATYDKPYFHALYGRTNDPLSQRDWTDPSFSYAPSFKDAFISNQDHALYVIESSCKEDNLEYFLQKNRQSYNIFAKSKKGEVLLFLTILDFKSMASLQIECYPNVVSMKITDNPLHQIEEDLFVFLLNETLDLIDFEDSDQVGIENLMAIYALVFNERLKREDQYEDHIIKYLATKEKMKLIKRRLIHNDFDKSKVRKNLRKKYKSFHEEVNEIEAYA